ncbi:MAG: guanylate cyclase, partial [Ignavibacteria bacterium]|nr:guanylate cyclase [Ignavibacteria bacterium]
MAGTPNRMLAAIMFSDMVGYTALMQEDESKAKTLRDRFRGVLRQCVDQHGGRVLQFYGDGALCSFTSTIEAVVCARKIHKALRADPKVLIRTGIHQGDVVFEKDGIYGDGVNVASRIEQLAPPGGICVSEKVYDEITNHSGIDAISLGHVPLKNVRRPVEIFVLMGDDLAAPVGGTMARADAFPAVLPIDKTRLAVLPLANFSSEAEDEYFSDGMTEELISKLSQINGLRVIARTSVMRYKDTKIPIAEIGRELKVGTVLEGSVRKSADKLRITVQLIDVESEEHIWSHDYDREDRDVFAIQSDIAHHVAEMLRLRLLSGEKHRIEKMGTENLEAFNLYLKGRYYLNMRTGEGLEKSVMNFNLAIEKDPAYALAHAGLADSCILLAGYGHAPPAQALSKAAHAARKAVELDDMLAESHTSLAGTVFHYFDWSTTERELQRAIELNPSYATSHHWYAVALAAMGRMNEAIEQEKQALDLDPLNSVINTYKG